MDPSEAMGTIMADSPEEAVEKIKADITNEEYGITDFEVISVEEVLSNNIPVEDLSATRTLN